MHQFFQPKDVRITGGFWEDILQTNAETAIFHQWDQLEESGAIENFRIATGESPHFRTGFFFSDSDVYKWLDAACRISLQRPSEALNEKIELLATLIRRAQAQDGYLFTYNQIHFPGQRWVALQIEHELYCHGHLIEACLAHHQAFPEGGMLSVATRAADLIDADFSKKPPHFQPGHQEIELVLLNLYEVTFNSRYLDLAERFLARRGRAHGHLFRLVSATLQSEWRARQVERRRKAHQKAHPELTPFTLPPMNHADSTFWVKLRFLASTLSGKYFQTHRPIPEQTEAVGHSVRFGYTMTAQARLLRQKGSSGGLVELEALWRAMVTRRMYVTGGLGSLPVLEGFGRDFELDPHLAYAETCATIASLLWDWELLLLTGKVCYADLMEWQLYNAALVGVGQDGHCYLYNNPLAADGELTREPWFRIPCCPSNISRVFAALGQYLFTFTEDTLTVQQYISGESDPNTPAPLHIRLESGFPWEPSATLTVLQVHNPEAHCAIRIPGWATGLTLTLNGELIKIPLDKKDPMVVGGGYSPFSGQYLTLPGPFHPDDRIEIAFHTAITPRRADPRVGLGRQDTALSYGPLVYCAESPDNPGVNLNSATLDLEAFQPAMDESAVTRLALAGKDAEGRPIRLIPYFAWANRGPSQMRVFFSIK